ncbi:MAG: FtsQ-type POTRA domain-containing protein [Bacteroidota bacterium]
MTEDINSIPQRKQESLLKAQKKKEIVGFLFLVIGIAVIAGGAIGWRQELTVDTIAIEGNHVVPMHEIMSLANIVVGSKLSTIKLTAIRERILQNAFIKEVTIRRDLPGDMVISVVERTPVAFINADQLISCDAEGIVMPHMMSAEVVNLPVISGIQNTERLQQGKAIEDTITREALTLLLYAAEIDSSVFQMISEVRPINDGEMVIYTTDCGIPVMIGRGRIAEKIAILSSFWKEVIRPGTSRSLESIDVRFQDQVVVRWADNARTSTQPG